MSVEDNWRILGKDKLWCNVHKLEFKVGLRCPSCPKAKIELKDKKWSKQVERVEHPLSLKDKLAYEMKQKGASYSTIMKVLKCSRGSAYNYVQNGVRGVQIHKGISNLNDKGVLNDSDIKRVRLHNDSISFLIEPIDLSMEKDCVKLKYSKYKLLRDVERGWHIQIFEKKLIVLFKKYIEAETEQECYELANDRIEDFLSNFYVPKVCFLNNEFQQVSRHYAIIGTDLAEHFIREKKKLIVLNKDNKVRARVDFSHHVPELDFEDIKTNKDDSKVWNVLIKDSLENPIDTLSVTKKKIDFLQQDYIKANVNFTEKMNWLAENIKSHQRVLEKLERGIDKLTRVKDHD